MATRARRPRKTDCASADGFQPLRQVSANTRVTQLVAEFMETCLRLRAASRASGSAVASRPLTPSSSRAWGRYAMLRIASIQIGA